MSKAIAVSVVIRDDKVLVQNRYRADKGMVYEFICGKVESGESLEETAIRELEEEVGLMAYQPFAYHEYSSKGMTIGFVLFKARLNEEPRITNPHRKQRFFWFKLEEIPLTDFPMNDQEFIVNELPAYLA